MDKIIAHQEDVGKRLDKFLAEKITKFSRSQIKKKILAEEVLVNEKKADVHKFLKEGDEIQFTNYESSDGHCEESPESFRGATKQSLSPARLLLRPLADRNDQNQAEPKIIFEDEDFLVIDKPSGVLVHPTARQEQNTLVDWLVQKYPEVKNVGEEKYREGIIHRLDKDVSGIMLVARTQAGFLHLKNQFKEKKILKKYLALVYGVATEHEGKIDLPIGRNEEGKFVAHPRVQNSKFKENDKYAITLYQLMDTMRDYSLLEVKILTGRTHQIRAHLSAIGHPIVGDLEYGPKKPFLKKFSKRIKVLNAPRIFLHSHTIGFYNLNNEWVEFEAPLPKELINFLGTLKM